MSFIGIIAGMHRSGTSALSRVMNLLGYDIPGELDTNTHHNASGHWEPVAFVALNMQIIAELGSDWCELRLPESSTFDAIGPGTLQDIARYADVSFGHHPYTVVKDPRVCYTLPLWIAEVNRRQHTCLILLPYRHPVEVAKSLAARDGMPLNSGLALWLCSMLSAEFYSRGQRRCAVGFSAFIADWRQAYAPVAALTGAAIPDRDDPLGAQIDGYVNREQRHHTVLALTDELRQLSLIDLALEAYKLFEQPLDEPTTQDAFDSLRSRVQQLIERDNITDANRHFATHYRHLRELDERDQVIATLRREMDEKNTIAQGIADAFEEAKQNHKIIVEHQARHIERLAHHRIVHEQALQWHESQAEAATDARVALTQERDWLRESNALLTADQAWLRTVIADQERLLWPIRLLLRLWHRLRKRSVTPDHTRSS
ncbi:MAG: hypothetical protein RLY87_1990 [Chloroflexota bacterium]|jgi:hypothetical protein